MELKKLNLSIPSMDSDECKSLMGGDGYIMLDEVSLLRQATRDRMWMLIGTLLTMTLEMTMMIVMKIQIAMTRTGTIIIKTATRVINSIRRKWDQLLS